MGQQANPMQCPMLQADYPVVIPAPPAPVSQILQEWSTAYNLETAYFRSVGAAWEEPEPNNEKPIDDEIDAVSRWPAYLVSIESTEKSPDQDDKACPDTMMISLDAIQGSSPTVQQLESYESIGSAGTSGGQADEELPETMRKSFSARFVSLVHTCQRRRCH